MGKKLFLFFLPFVFFFVLLLKQDPSFTQDLGRHIKVGELILSCSCVPNTNMFSFTEPSHPFINHHWLSEVVFYLLYTYLGVQSLLVLKVVLLFISFGIIYFITFKNYPFWAFVFSFFYIFMFQERFDTRPELFSFLFLSVFLFLIHRYRETKRIQLLLPLPFIELLWANMHIYFVLGPILVGALLLEEIVKQKKKSDFKVIILVIITSLMPLINPNGLTGAIQPLTILQRYGYSIIENQNIFFLNGFFFNPRILVFEVLAVLLIVLLFIGRKYTSLFYCLIACFFTFEAAFMIRNFPLFILGTFFTMVSLTSSIVQSLVRDVRQMIVGGVVVALAVFVLFTTYNAVTSPLLGFWYGKSAENAVAFFKKNNIKGPIFNNFDIGSYLIFKLYPQEKVFVDGRPESYSVEFFDRYKKIQEDPALFDKAVKKYTINTIFFAHTDITPWAQTFLRSITANKEWVIVYLDERIIILVRNSSENHALIQKYKRTL